MTDPVGDGFVQSLAHPGGNLTGFGEFIEEVMAKRMGLLKELVPRLRRLLVLLDPQDPMARAVGARIQRARATLKLQVLEREVTTQADI